MRTSTCGCVRRLFYLDRIDQLGAVAKLLRKPSEYVQDNVFATDHPFVPHPARSARRFLEDSALTEAERLMVASGNWQRLRREIRR
jgi:hypothetical protein